MRFGIILLTIIALCACQTVPMNNKTDKITEHDSLQDQNVNAKELNAVEQAFNDSKIAMIFSDISFSFWKEDTDIGAMCFSLFLIDKSGILKQHEILKMRITDNAGHTWTQELKDQGTVIGRWVYNYSTAYEANGSVLSIDPYIVSIETKDKKKFSKYFNPRINMSTIRQGSKFINSNDYSGSDIGGYTSTLKRPIINRAIISANSITIDFALYDQRIKNGSVEFYSETKECLGGFEYFYNEITNQTFATLNTGNGIKTNGIKNTIILSDEDIGFHEGRTFSEISKIIITVYDHNSLDFDSLDMDQTILSTKSEMTDCLIE